MYKRQWKYHELKTYDDWLVLRDGIKRLHPKVAAFDTETTGLHIILDSPFLFQFGFLDPTNETRAYALFVDLRENPDGKKIIKEWHEIAEQCDLYLGHNIKFDLHMLMNIGLPYTKENVSDTQAYIRYACDALHQSEGGPPLSLKDFAAKYIDPACRFHEQLLAKERTKIAADYNINLKYRLSSLGAPPPPYTQKSYTLSVIEDMFKDPIFDEDNLPENVRAIYKDWKKNDLPIYLQNKVTALVESDMIRYSDLNTDNLHRYAHMDIVLTLEIYELLKPILEQRENQTAVELENKLIFPFFEMERTGFLADKEYLEKSRIKIKNYIIKLRMQFWGLAGCKIKIGQHEAIKRIMQNKYGIEMPSTNNTEMDLLKNKLEQTDPKNPVLKFITVLSELRTLEKWYSVYIMRFKKELEVTDRLYTTIHSVGTVSGRVTSDFQQFPKEPIIDQDGNELFHPRKLVKVPPHCEGLLYLDYSQIELRFQAIYTILVGHPDLNLCRAYMPYKCHLQDGTPFDYNNQEHIKHWNDSWYMDENNERWTPTDVHAATTEAAGFSRSDPNFGHYRKVIGKRVNFAKNYGASLGKIMEMFPDRSKEECKRIDAAYYTAFPGVKEYHNYCYSRAQHYPCTSNLFGIKYYKISGHKLRNTLIQGSAAHFLKYRIRALYDYMKKNNLKSRFQMQIHDELVFEIAKGEYWIIPQLKRIMEDWPETPVPVIAEAEWTTTNWAEKKSLP